MKKLLILHFKLYFCYKMPKAAVFRDTTSCSMVGTKLHYVFLCP